MGTATAGGPDRATKAADAGVACPLLEGIDLSGARRPASTSRSRAVCCC
jgi:cell division protein FtsZ